MWRGHKEGRTDDDADLRDLLRSLETTCNLVAIPLRSLILTFNRAADQAVSGLVKFAKTLNAPRLNSLEVDIKSLGALATQTVDARLPSVVCLKLCGPYRFDSVGDLRGLQTMFALCPALKTLRLQQLTLVCTDDSGEPVSRVDIKGAILDAIAAGQLPFAFPGVSALLFFLQQTTVLDLYLEDWSLEGVHWHRLARNEVFEAEGWTTI